MIIRIEEEHSICYRLENGVCHRPNGPAVEFKADKTGYWFLFGKRHRYYGPASHANNWFWIHDKRVK
jgi:hypothetical protein